MATYQTDDGEWTMGDTANVEVKDERDDLPIFVHSELDDLPISADAFRVYAHLARRRNKDKKAAWPSYASMGQTCFGTEKLKPGSMRNKVIRAMNELLEFGLITVERRTRRDGGDDTNFYRLTPRKEWRVSRGESSQITPPVIPDNRGSHPPSPKGTTSIQGEQEEEKQIEEVTPASQAQPQTFTILSLQDELTALNGNGPVASTSRKKQTVVNKVTTVSPGDANNYHQEMFAALAAMCVLDPNVKRIRGQLNATSKALRDAGYTVADLDKYKAWWKSQDWRGRRGDKPILGIIPTQILQAVQWVPQTAWVPPVQAAKPKGYDLSTLRSWHKQHYYEEWNYRVAAELGISPTLPGAFKEWYESEVSIPDDQLADWYEQHLAASKEKQQW